MNNFIPFDKLSKKKQKELNAQRRKDWGNINPVTRKTKNKKAYNRQKARKIDDDFNSVSFVLQKINEKKQAQKSVCDLILSEQESHI